MSKGNKSARRELERIFGKICMIEELGIRKIPVNQRRKIKGYTRYDDVLTFHHLKERCKGGQATVENGAILKGYNHRWLHSLPEDQKQKINNSIIEFKAAFIQVHDKGLQIESAQAFELDFDMSDCIEIPLFDNTKEDLEKKEKFNRAKVKRETQRLIDEELYEEVEDDEYQR